MEEQHITKSLLQSIHRKQLMRNESNNPNKEAILSTLGGIDKILSIVLELNVCFTQNQLHSLHNIINNTHSQNQNTIIKSSANIAIEDKGYTQKLRFTFNDNDTLLHSIFNQKTATNIITGLNHKITKSILVSLSLLWILARSLLQSNVLSNDVYWAYYSFFALVLSIYFFGWILYANKEAMKLLCKDFEFWFKLFYLTLFVTARIPLQLYETRSIYGICALFLCQYSLLFLVMIFDAIIVKQSNKILISSFALGVFAWSALLYLQISFYRIENDMYSQSTVTIPDWFGVGSMQLNITDITTNSAQILCIFLMKQMVSLIRKPKQALVIKSKPIMIYENHKESIPNRKSLKNWKRATILVWVIYLFLILFGGFVEIRLGIMSNTGRVLRIMYIFATLCVICLLMSGGKMTFLWSANIVIFVFICAHTICVFLVKWDSTAIVVLFFGFGLTAIYALETSKWNEIELTENVSPKIENERMSDITVHTIDEIVMKHVRKGNHSHSKSKSASQMTISDSSQW